jgi:DNA-binding NarL/FixJ family response regulator
MRSIHILIADDQVLFAESLKIVLENKSNDIKVVGIAFDGVEAIRSVEKYKPDLVLMDIYMPKIDGIEATKILHKKCPTMRILILTTMESMKDMELALKNGASGYLLKNIAPDDLVNSIKVIMVGDILITSTFANKFITKSIIQESDSETRYLSTKRPSWLENLNAREKEILLLIIQGLSSKEIAQLISIGEQTVRNYLGKIYAEMGVNSKSEAIDKAKSIYLLDRQILT